MKILVMLIVLTATAFSCQKSEVVDSPFTGNETTYSLQQSSQYAISGSVVFKEMKNGNVNAVIKLSGTDGVAKFPVHLHLGDITAAGTDVALLMTPVDPTTGKSETTFNQLADESKVSYSSLVNMQACVKIHLGDTGSARDVILAAGNIGAAVSNTNPGGRLGIGICSSSDSQATSYVTRKVIGSPRFRYE